MNRNLAVGLLVFLVFLNGCAAPPEPQPDAKDLAILQSWSGDYPVTALEQLPVGQTQNPVGWIGEAKTFAVVWDAFMPGQPVPVIDFAKHLVVYSRNVEFYNRTNIFKVTLSGETVEILAMQTMSARPIEEQVAMAVAVVPRAGIKQLKVNDMLTLPVE